MSWTITPTQLLVDDQDALTYLTAVEAADGQALESGVRLAVNAFVKGCKADGIWPAIKASCILAGAHTLSGALVPLVGTAPTNVGPFVSGDYNRKTGLVGNGSTKYLNTNRAASSSSKDNTHISIYLSSAGSPSTSRTHLGSEFVSGSNYLTDIFASNTNALILRNGNANGNTGSAQNLFGNPAGSTTGYIGTSRSFSTQFSMRFGNNSYLSGVNSDTLSINPPSTSYLVFARNGVTPSVFADSRVAFYSIGESLNLALLDARVTTLVNALSAAIP